MKEYTIIELSTFVVAILSGIAMLCGTIQKSKCKSVKFCGVECERDERAIEMDLERGAAAAQPL